MISRRIIRTKVMQALYAFHCNDDKSINLAEKELFFSVNKSYDLYHLLLQLPIDVKNYAQHRIDLNRQKKVPTREDLNPCTKFVKNEIIAKLEENEVLAKYLTNNKLSWGNYPELIKKLYCELIETSYFKEYMNKSEASLSDDRKLVEFFYTEIVVLSDDMDSILEEQSIYWNDDLEFVASMAIKTIDKFKMSTMPSKSLLPLFKDEDDRDFMKNLFRRAVLNEKEHREIIESHLKNWDIERVAFIDVLIMKMAICEFLYFPSIPTKVSLNEYIDMAKYYSTSKSRTFINGILDKILKDLKDNGKIEKIGRGLVGEITE
jgi:transcription antitermination protein NusB